MAYANLLSVSCASRQEVFQRLRDFLCKRNGTYDYSSTGIGWTLHDSSYAVNEDSLTTFDWFVAYSAGEAGGQDMYFKFTYNSTLNQKCVGYLYWNSGTNTEVEPYGDGYGLNINTSSASSMLWVYGDLDSFVIVDRNDSNLNYCYAAGHMPDSPVSQAVSTVAGTITAGSNRVVTFSSVPGAWGIGTKLFVRDNASIERVTISNISGNDVTFSSFTKSYAAGSKFALEVSYFGQYSTAFLSTNVFLIGHEGTKNTSHGVLFTTSNTQDLDSLADTIPAIKVYNATSTTVFGPQSHILRTGGTQTDLSTHTLGAVSYRLFTMAANSHALIKEV